MSCLSKTHIICLTVYILISFNVKSQEKNKLTFEYLKGKWYDLEQNDSYCLTKDTIKRCDECFCLSWDDYINDSVMKTNSGAIWYYKIDNQNPIIHLYFDSLRRKKFISFLCIIVDNKTFYEVFSNQIIKKHRDN